MFFLLVVQTGSPRLSKGKKGVGGWGEERPRAFDVWTQILKSEPQAKTVFISPILGNQVESSGGHFLFSCSFHFVNYLPTERMEFLWLETGVQQAMVPEISSFSLSPLCYLSYPTLAGVFPSFHWTGHQKPVMVPVGSWQICGLIIFPRGSTGEQPQGLVWERNICRDYFWDLVNSSADSARSQILWACGYYE